jgi:hypothetical protein
LLCEQIAEAEKPKEAAEEKKAAEKVAEKAPAKPKMGEDSDSDDDEEEVRWGKNLNKRSEIWSSIFFFFIQFNSAQFNFIVQQEIICAQITAQCHIISSLSEIINVEIINV